MRRIHACGAVLLLGAALLSWMSHWIDPTALDSEVAFVLATVFVMTAAYSFACWRILKHGASLRVVLLWAFAARVALAPSLPIYETDAFRYVWDGFGVSPYQFSPQQVVRAFDSEDEPVLTPGLSLLIGELQSRPEMVEVLRNVNNAELNTIYPPFTQLLFGSTALLAPGSIFVWRMTALIFDGLLIASIIYLLGAFRIDPSRIVFYAWSPLALKVYINTAHFDVIALCGLFVVFALMQAKRSKFAATALACAVQTKIFPLFVFPLFIKQWRWPQWSVFALALSLLAGMFMPIGEDGLRGWSAFLQRWEANSSLVALLEWGFVKLGVPGWGEGVILARFSGAAFHLDAFLIAKVFAGCVWLIGWALICRRAWRRPAFDLQETIHDAFLIIALLLVCSPVCNPWYLAWVVPFLCFHPRASWMYLTAACFVYYTFFIHAPSQQPTLVRALEYCPFYALLIWEWKTGRLSRNS